jgi:hypothetical protein
MTYPLGFIKFPTATGFAPQDPSECLCIYSLTTWDKILFIQGINMRALYKLNLSIQI